MDEETRKKLEEWNQQVGKRPFKKKEVGPQKKRGKEITTKPAGSGTKRPGPDFIPQESKSKISQTPETQEREMSPPTESNFSEEKKETKTSPLKEARKREMQKNEKLLARIRTYEGDAAQAIKKKKTSVSSIVAAEQKRADKERRGQAQKEARGVQPKTKSSKTALYAIISIVLIAGGIGALYGWYAFVYIPNQEVTTEAGRPETLIPANNSDEFTFSLEGEESLVEALTAIKNNPPVGEGEVYAVSFVTKEEGPEGEEIITPLPARAFLETLEINAPVPLYRSLETTFTYGAHRHAKGSSAFLIFKTDFFENAFASMLGWEKSIARDLSFLVENIDNGMQVAPVVVETGTSTDENATSTEGSSLPRKEPTLLGQEFRDLVIKNQDTRILRDSAGNIRLIYSFPTQETLIITGSIDTFEEILRRLNLIEFE